MRSLHAPALALVLASAGCDLANPGAPVPVGRLNFPIAIAVAGPPGAPPTTLLVANSNFDLRYASGTLQSYSLGRIDALIRSRRGAEACPVSLESDVDRDGVPDTAPCTFTNAEVALEPFVSPDDPSVMLPPPLDAEVAVGSHMDGLVVSGRGDRAYLPVRSAGGLTWVTVGAPSEPLGSSSLLCTNEGGAIPSCDGAHRRADDTIARARGLTLPSDPVALAVGPISEIAPERTDDGTEYIVMAHRNGSVSLFLDRHAALGDPNFPPELLDTITGAPNDIVSIERDGRGNVWLTSGALSGARQTRDLVAVRPILAPNGLSGSLAIAQRHTLRGVDDGLDTRDIAIDHARPAAEPLRLWVLARRPESIITVDFALPPLALGEAPIGRIYETVGFGPSRLERAVLDYGVPGAPEPHTLLIASCYDAHALFIVDPGIGLVATVPGMDGPFEVAVDASAMRAYVVDFRFSVIWVVDLAPIARGGSPRMLARLGSGQSPSVFAR